MEVGVEGLRKKGMRMMMGDGLWRIISGEEIVVFEEGGL